MLLPRHGLELRRVNAGRIGRWVATRDRNPDGIVSTMTNLASDLALRGTRACLAAALLLITAAPAPAEWVRVESPNFILFGEIGERRTRDYAHEFERFREALAKNGPGRGRPRGCADGRLSVRENGPNHGPAPSALQRQARPVERLLRH